MADRSGGPSPWCAIVLTLYPKMFPGPLNSALTGRALNKGLWDIETVDIRKFATDKHASVDAPPAGGGPGMVMRSDIVAAAIDHSRTLIREIPTYCLSPRGKPFTQSVARILADGNGAIFLCGRFEGIDERVLDSRNVEELSVGDFLLSGGELAAMAVIDSVVRLLPGVVGSPDSLKEESFENGLLEYPQYTRPNNWEGMKIPEVLTSGHHRRVGQWRKEQSERITRERRPDLWEKYTIANDKKMKL